MKGWLQMNHFKISNKKALQSKASLTGVNGSRDRAVNRLGDVVENKRGISLENRVEDSLIASPLISRIGELNFSTGENTEQSLLGFTPLRADRSLITSLCLRDKKWDLAETSRSQEEPFGLLLGNEKVIVESFLPIRNLLQMSIDHQTNEHATFSMQVEIIPEAQSFFLNSFFQGQEIKIFANHETGEPTLLFCGRIQSATGEKENQHLYATIDGISYSVELDEWERYCSFQNINLTYQSIVQRVTGEVGARFVWSVGSDRAINKPFIQYDETNWSFIKRLASYFGRPIIASPYSNQPDFYFGVRDGEIKSFAEKDIMEFGISDQYYESGGYEAGHPREHYRYLKIKHRESWQLGDKVSFGHQRMTVIHHQVKFERGELIYLDTLGAEGFLYQKRIPHHRITGVNLGGWIRKVEQESVYVQFDFDNEERADYPWPWTPEVGNLAYIMPEVNSRVALMFPTDEEQEGTATHLLRMNTGSPVFEHVENKQFFTRDQKIAGLFPGQIVLSGKDGDTKITLEDQSGVSLNTVHGINLRAQGEINLIGNKVSLVAPRQVAMQTPQSNIIMAKNFNLFAPSGVITKSSAPPPPARIASKIARENHNHLPLSFATLGALPRINPKRVDRSALLGLGAIATLPKMARGQSTIAMSEMMGGRKAEQTSFPKSFSSFGNHTTKGGFLVPSNLNLNPINERQKIKKSFVRKVGSTPPLNLNQSSLVIGRITSGITNMKSMNQFNRMGEAVNLKSRIKDVGVGNLMSRIEDSTSRDFKSGIEANISRDRSAGISLGEAGITNKKARLENVNFNGAFREDNQGARENIGSLDRKSRV